MSWVGMVTKSSGRDLKLLDKKAVRVSDETVGTYSARNRTRQTDVGFRPPSARKMADRPADST